MGGQATLLSINSQLTLLKKDMDAVKKWDSLADINAVKNALNKHNIEIAALQKNNYDKMTIGDLSVKTLKIGNSVVLDNEGATVPKLEIGPRDGNSHIVYNIWASSLPLGGYCNANWSSKDLPKCLWSNSLDTSTAQKCKAANKVCTWKGGYNQHPIHLKTDWDVKKKGQHFMFAVEFRGHLFREGGIIHAVTQGYLNGASGIWSASMTTMYTNSISVWQYMDPKDGKLVFRIQERKPTNTLWHASNMYLNFLGGPIGYHTRALNSFKIISAKHMPDPKGATMYKTAYRVDIGKRVTLQDGDLDK